jgi:catechol 2,3-dioxygenase-like lactoylglutathione lyase family enzyme
LTINAKFAHTNIIAQDWEKIVEFYREVFGCKPLYQGQDLSGRWLEDITGVPDAKLRVIHMLLPGHGDDGPTLEVIRYHEQKQTQETAANRPGFGHIAFIVDDVQAAHDAVLAAGGGTVGEIITVDLPGRGTVTEVYATDPEGNIIELQKWAE